jgi:hypothetical protein
MTRVRRIIQFSLVVALVTCLAGCSEGWTESDLRLRWKWFHDREIPITEPTVVSDDDPRLATESEVPSDDLPPAVVPAPIEDPDLGPVPEPAPTPPAPDVDAWGPQVSQADPVDPYADMVFAISEADALGPAGANEEDTEEEPAVDDGAGIRSLDELDDPPPAPTPPDPPQQPTPPADDESPPTHQAGDESPEANDLMVNPLEVEFSIDDGPEIEIADSGTVVAASMVQVNDKFITTNEVLNELHQALATMPLPNSEYVFRQEVAEMIQMSLRDRVYEILVLARAEMELTDQHKAVVEEELITARREMIAHAGGSEQALRNYYRERHTTIEEVLESHRGRLMAQLYLQSYIEPKIVVTPQAMLRYYEEHRSEFQNDKRVQMQIIASPIAEFLPAEVAGEPSPQEWQTARGLARRNIDLAAGAVLDGQEFGQVAKRYSRGYRAATGGLFPMMERGNLRETEIERNLFALDAGEMCGIIETDEGYYIIRALAVEEGQTLSFEDAQGEIERILSQQIYEELLGEYYSELFDDATIVQAEEFLDLALDTAVERYYRLDR